MGCHGQMPPAPRRRGLYERISDRACLARGAGVAHLWRHQRDHEGADRPEPVTETPARTFTVTLADEGAISVPFDPRDRSEEHTSELQSLMRISYAVFCLQKKKNRIHITPPTQGL